MALGQPNPLFNILPHHPGRTRRACKRCPGGFSGIKLSHGSQEPFHEMVVNFRLVRDAGAIPIVVHIHLNALEANRNLSRRKVEPRAPSVGS
jgi:hypothetical protein